MVSGKVALRGAEAMATLRVLHSIGDRLMTEEAATLPGMTPTCPPSVLPEYVSDGHLSHVPTSVSLKLVFKN